MAQKIFEHCIIGSGVSALGAALGLLDQGVQDLCLIADPRDELQYYAPIQILRYLGVGGTSRYWHGVIPTRPDIAWRRQIFTRFFDHRADIWSADNLFVPKTPLRTGSQLRNLLSPDQQLSATAAHIALRGDVFEVTTQDGESLLTRKVWCAAGVIGSLGILSRSGFCSHSVVLGDHICGFLGMLTAPQAEILVGRAVAADRGPDGYSVPCRFSEDGRTLFTLRPAKFEMRDPYRQNRGGPKFAIGRRQMIWDLVKSRSFGRLSEAVALKMGIGFQASMYAVHFQHECLTAHICDGKTETLLPIYDPVSVADQVTKTAADLEVGLGLVPQQHFYYGTHLFGAQGLSGLPQGLHVVDATMTPTIGGGHHSFTQLVQAYRAVQKVKER